MQASMIVLATFLVAVPSRAQDRCTSTLDVGTVIRRSASLDGKTVCVKGWIYPIRGRAPSASFITELLPIGAEMSTGLEIAKKQAIGVVEGPTENNADEYDPESFRKLDDLPSDAGTPPFAIEVVLRGVIMVGRGLADRVAKGLPSDSLYDPLRRVSHNVELVTLQVISAQKRAVPARKPAHAKLIGAHPAM
jgi:hypothetical protein